MNNFKLLIYLLVIASTQAIGQPELSDSRNEEKMRRLDSLKVKLYGEFNLSAAVFRNLYDDEIIRDTILVVNEPDSPYDSLLIVETKNLFWGIGKSIKRNNWNLVFLYSESEKFFKKFGLNSHTTIQDIVVIFDSTNSYKFGDFEVEQEERINRFVISFPDTEEFIFFTEFIFHLESDSLIAVSVDFLENR